MSNSEESERRRRGLIYAIIAVLAFAAIAAGTWSVIRRASLSELGAPAASGRQP
jgi:hypothetical protein